MYVLTQDLQSQLPLLHSSVITWLTARLFSLTEGKYLYIVLFSVKLAMLSLISNN